MLHIRGSWREKGRRLWLGRRAHLLAVGVGCLAGSGIASAAEAAASQAPAISIPAAQMFTLLFLMLGPFKIIAPFSRITRGADPELSRRIALRAILFSSLALLIAAFLGESILRSYGIPLPVLSLAGGIILFLVALQSIIQQFVAPESHGAGAGDDGATPKLNMALMPLAFPTIVTPYGIAALVVFLAFSPELQGRLIIGAILLVIMLLNLVVMLLARRILPVLSVLLPVLGAVLGVVQVALGLQIINRALRMLLAA